MCSVILFNLINILTDVCMIDINYLRRGKFKNIKYSVDKSYIKVVSYNPLRES